MSSQALQPIRRAATRIALLLACVLAGARPSFPAPTTEKLEVWIDDAHTRQIEVEKLDPDQIAEESSLKLSLGASIGNVGISIGWSREKGVAYEERARQLIERIEELCKEFNKGQLSLETYDRRLRRILGAAQEARLCRLELLAATSIESDQAGQRLDRALGLPEQDCAQHRHRVEQAMAEFRELVHGIDQPVAEAARDATPVGTAAGEGSKLAREAVERSLAAIDAGLSREVVRQLERTEKINIWADRARTRRVVVPKLDVEHLVEDFEDSLGLRLKCSPPLFSLTVGPKMVQTLHEKAEYDSAATLLIVKYRALCLEYNSGLLCQEDYVDRLQELREAERLSADARGRFLDQLDAGMDSARDRLAAHLGRQDSAATRDILDRKREMRQATREQTRESGEDSLVDELSQGHVEQMQAWELFKGAVDAVEVSPPRSSIEVWVDEARTRKVRVPRLDTDLLAQNVKTRITLHISYFRFGPEAEWARDRGLEYDATAQELIVKSKQLCMDYNAGLVPQETFDRRRAAIDASLERAARVQERVIEFTRELKGTARDELDRRLELRRKR